MIEDIPLPVRTDMEIEQKDLILLDYPEGIGEVGPALAQRFDLGTCEHDPALPGIQDFVVVSRPFVAGDQFRGVFGIRVCHT